MRTSRLIASDGKRRLGQRDEAPPRPARRRRLRASPARRFASRDRRCAGDALIRVIALSPSESSRSLSIRVIALSPSETSLSHHPPNHRSLHPSHRSLSIRVIALTIRVIARSIRVIALSIRVCAPYSPKTPSRRERERTLEAREGLGYSLYPSPSIRGRAPWCCHSIAVYSIAITHPRGQCVQVCVSRRTTGPVVPRDSDGERALVAYHATRVVLPLGGRGNINVLTLQRAANVRISCGTSCLCIRLCVSIRVAMRVSIAARPPSPALASSHAARGLAAWIRFATKACIISASWHE